MKAEEDRRSSRINKNHQHRYPRVRAHRYLRLQSVEEVGVHGDVPCQEVFQPVGGLDGLEEQGAEGDVIADIQPEETRGRDKEKR